MVWIAWRLQRAGFLGMTAVGAIYGLFQVAGYRAAAGASAASRVAFGHQMEDLGRTLTLLLPVPARLDTVGGYLQWRVFGALPLLFGVWALFAAAGAIRGDERRGLVEAWLASGVRRDRYVVVRFTTFALAALIVTCVTSAAIDLGTVGSGLSLDTVRLAQATAVILATTLVPYALTLVLAHVPPTRGAAAALAGAVLAVLFLLNSASRTTPDLRPVARLVSPFYYVDRSDPLTPGGNLDPGATIVLFAVTVLLVVLAAWLMRTRDINAPLFRIRARDHPVAHSPSPNRWLRFPVLSALYEQRVGLVAWAAGSGIGGAYVASLGRSMVDHLVKAPEGLHAYLSVAAGKDAYIALTGYFWFGIFQLVLVAFALAQAARWTSEDNEGRLEMTLSAPLPRWRIVAERGVTFLICAAVIVAAGSVGFFLAARGAGIHVQATNLVVASLCLLPFVLSFGAVGAVLTSRAPRAAIALLAGFAFLSYVITEGGPLLKWPDWALHLSAFSLYGTPLSSGVYWGGLWILLVIAAGGFGLGAILMQRRDVGS